MSPKPLLRLFRSEIARLMLMGFLVGSAGFALTQPGQAQTGAEPSTISQAR